MKLQPNLSRGFTLIELLVTVSLIALLAGLAAPALSSFVTRSAMRSVNTDFSLALQRTRLEAVNRNTCATMCMSTTAGTDNPKCTVLGDDWQRGWIVFHNPTCSGTITAADPLPGNIVLVRDSSGARYSLTNLAGNSDLRAVTFSSRGATSLATSGFVLADGGPRPDTKLNKTICLDSLGRVRSIDSAGSC
jgi:type IV fimbrial biogenesis protein FimT